MSMLSFEQEPKYNSGQSNVEHFPTADKLHTDVLEERYGPIHAESERHDDVRSFEPSETEQYPIREAHLRDEQGISRTYALTFLTYDPDNEELYKIDSEIRSGGAIGKTFRDHGYQIRKNVIDVFTLQLTPKLKQEFNVQDDDYAKARISEFYARKEHDEPTIYGRVLEVYTPDFRGPVINEIDTAQVNPSTDILKRYGVSKDQIWERLADASRTDEWDDMKDRYQKAKEESLPEVFEWRKRINSYLHSS